MSGFERIQQGITVKDFHAVAEGFITEEGVFPLFNASIGEFDLSSIDCSSLEQLSLVNCRFGSLTLPRSPIAADIAIGSSEIDLLEGDSRTYESRVTLSDCTIDRCRFSGSKFTEMFQLEACMIREEAELSSTTFEEMVFLSQPDEEIGRDRGPTWQSDPTSIKQPTTFECTVNWSRSVFKDFTRFTGTRFEQGCHFDSCQFGELANFTDARLARFANFKLCEFASVANFSDVDAGYTTFEMTEFHDSALFNDAVFRSSITRIQQERSIYNHMQAEGDANTAIETNVNQSYDLHLLDTPVGLDWDLNLHECQFQKLLRLDSVSYLDGICLQHATVPNMKVLAIAGNNGRIALDDATVAEGTVRFFWDDNPFLTVKRADLGDLSLTSTDDINPFENVYFLDTRFDRFDFGRFRMLLSEVGHDLLHRWTNDDYVAAKAEQQFANARIAATQQGDNHAASKFFVKEKRHRRSRYLSELRSNNGVRRFRAGYDYLTNAVLDALCVYGESPRRIFELAVLTILIFAGLYSYLDAPVEYELAVLTDLGVPVPIAEAITYILFSIEVTATLVLVSPDIVDPVIRLLTAIQGFTGAFFVALLVFTLTKSLHR